MKLQHLRSSNIKYQTTPHSDLERVAVNRAHILLL